MENVSAVEAVPRSARPPNRSFREQLIDVCRDRFPEALERTVSERRRAERHVESVERRLADKEVADILDQYGFGECDIEEMENGYFRIPVHDHFSRERLPEGYGYKGGAARALLLRNLGVDPAYTPRDIDVVRLVETEPYPNADKEVSEYFMPEDAAYGYGVETIGDTEAYFNTRDFTLNEAFATDTEVVASRACVLDSLRHIIRLTSYERHRIDDQEGPNSKILAKALRLYAEAICRYDEAAFENIRNWEFEECFISPFWLALQLDRSYELGEGIARRFVEELVRRRQLPEGISTPEEAALCLVGLMQDRPFHYRHAPTRQFKLEQSWLEEEWESLPKRMGMGRGGSRP